jgi:osmotically-inducible protein OsmY
MSLRSLRKSGVALGSLAILAALACNNDDTALTARTQSRVNQAVTPESEIQVNADDGVVTLTGLASSDAMHARAVAAARSVEGVQGLVDHISTPASLTGGKVAK